MSGSRAAGAPASAYTGRRVAVLTQHGKERVIAPVLDAVLGVGVERVDGADRRPARPGRRGIMDQDSIESLQEGIWGGAWWGAIVRQHTHSPGTITLEDILEEVVGEIYDEADDGIVKKIWSLRTSSRRY